MELPVEVLIHNELLGLKGVPGMLLRISPDGFYLINCSFGKNRHRVLLPIDTTVLISKTPEEPFSADFEVER